MYYIEIKPYFRSFLFLRKASFQRNSHWRCSVRKGVFVILQILQQNTCVGVSFNKVTGFKACNVIEKRLRHKCFLVKFAKFSRTPILKNICEQLLLSSLLTSYVTWYVGTHESKFIFFPQAQQTCSITRYFL